MSRAMPLPTTLAAVLAVVVAVECARPAAASAAAARAEQCRGATCGAGDGDETGLLQRRAAVGTLEAPGASAGPVMAVTFEGGGFRALASYAAITSALLKASGEAGSADGLARLFRNVDVIASNSGGTWFQAMAAYSPSFTGLLDDMTYVTSEMAGQRFYDLVLTPFIGALTEARLARGRLETREATRPTMAKSEDVQDSIGGMFNALVNYTTGGGVILEGWPDLTPLRDLIFDLYEIVQELEFAGRFDSDWDLLVETLFEAGAGITPGSQLGADVLPWAAGKTWLISVTLPTLGGDGVGTCRGEGQKPKSIMCKFFDVDSMRVVRNGSDTTSYQARSSLAHQPGQVPARFSLKLGAGVDQEAPQPFCAPGICSSMTMDYATKKGGRATSAPLDFSPFMTPGLLPIASVAAVSSAAFGILTTMAPPDISLVRGLAGKIVRVCKMWGVEKCDELGKFLFNALVSDFAMWALFKDVDQPVPPADIFKAGSDLREKLMLGDASAPQVVLDAMAAGQFMAMYDGGLVDNTAIATAVAGGATEIVAFLDSVSNLWGLFAGAPETESLLGEIDTIPLAYIDFQVFNETVASAKQQFNDSAQTFHLPPHAKKLLKLQVGTVVATTVDSPYFGISKGKTVTIHAINIDTDVQIGGYMYQDYGVLIKELMQAFERSPEPAKTILDWLAK